MQVQKNKVLNTIIFYNYKFIHLKMLQKQQRRIQQSLKGVFQSLNRLKNRQSNPQTDCIEISNHNTKFQLLHGSQFRDMLDPRDQVLQHQFSKIFNMNQDTFRINAEEFVQSKLYKDILIFIKKFLVETVSNIVSIAFNYLINDKLQQKQAKCFAAKNIVLNIQSIFTQTVKAIQKKQQMIQNVNLQDVKIDLINKIELMLTNIFLNLQDHYPQAPVTGGTQRMKSVIHQIDRVDDQENDLIYSNKIKIKDFIKTQIRMNQFNREEQKIKFDIQDHTDFIMKVINTAINVTQLCENDKKERSIKEIFTEFSQQLFWVAGKKQFKQNNLSLQQKQKLQQNQKLKDICNSLIQIFPCEQMEQISRSLNSSLQLKIKQLQQLKHNKKYEIGQKIPNFIKQFNKKQIKQNKFTAKHSSILRILTKWSEYLQDIFVDAERNVKMRLYPFKNINSELCTIYNVENQEKLISQLRTQYRKVKSKVQKLKQQTTKITSQILSNDYDITGLNVCRFSETRQFSSKINAVLSSIMIQYLSILIHHLLIAGKDIRTNVSGKYKTDNINLIVFRVSDLLRAKFQCNQTTFINVLQTMYMLDENQKIRNKFKLVRIKNKLEDPANNIMINFMFMGKVQCQLQLSIQESKSKEKKYYTFSHFVYELMRGKFGPISECSIMISQLDPMINSCKSIYYRQRQIKQEYVKRYQSKQQISKQGYKRKQTVTFDCKKCNQFVIIKQKHAKSPVKKKQRQCKKCLIQKQNNQIQINNSKQKQIISRLIADDKIFRVQKYSQLLLPNDKIDKKITPAICLNENQQLQLALVLYNKRQLKYFMVKINHDFISKIKDKHFDFSLIDYIDISKKIKQYSSNDGLLLYKINANLQQIVHYISQYTKVKKITALQIQQSINIFLQYRLQKSIIKSIKFKTQIFNCNEDQLKFETFHKIVNILLRNYGQQNYFQKLKYKKYKRIELSRLRIIRTKNAGINEVPQEINYLKNLVQLNLQGNNISSIHKLTLTNLTRLNINKNDLKNIDLSQLCNLTHLYIQQNQLQRIEGLSALGNLTQLYLRNNHLTYIDLSAQINLTHLYLQKNKLVNIEGSSALRKLTQLYLWTNQLTNIDLSALVNLTKLDLRVNKLTEINLSSLGNLTQLYLSQNKLAIILGLPKCLKLLKLQIQKNSEQLLIQQLPVSIKQLSTDLIPITNFDFQHKINLTRLWIYNGEITRDRLINIGEKVKVAYQQ